MRTWTIALSIVVHLIAACAAAIVPLLATDELPAPRTATEFIEVVPPPQPPPPPACVSATRTVDQPRADAAPLVVPDGIEPEPAVTPYADTPPADGGIISFASCNCAVEETIPAAAPSPSGTRWRQHQTAAQGHGCRACISAHRAYGAQRGCRDSRGSDWRRWCGAGRSAVMTVTVAFKLR
jgi:hypothetical protein